MIQKIKSITEAFSMQPQELQVTPEYNLTKEQKYYHLFIKEILYEDTEIDGKIIDVYVGYDWNGNKMFQYLANSVNVHYYYE